MSNKAAIVKKYIITAPLQLESPLLIGSGENDWITDIKTVCDSNGYPYIPGTSLAGVLRDRLEEIYDAGLVAELLGTADSTGQSLLNIADVKLPQAKLVERDGVAIDNLTGSAIDGAKFDYQLVERGAKGLLQIEVTLRRVHLESCAVYEEALQTICELLLQGVSVGAMSAKGLGKVKASSAGYYKFDFQAQGGTGYAKWKKYLSVYNKLAQAALENDRITWLLELEKELGAADYQAVATAPIVKEDNLVLEAYFDLSSALFLKEEGLNQEVAALLLKAAKPKDDTSAQEEKTNLTGSQMKSLENFVIPGTSWKGVLRGKAYKLLRKIAGKIDNEASCNTLLEKLMGKSETRRSRLKIAETYIDKQALVLKPQTRNRIDRLTGATQKGALFVDVPAWKASEKTDLVKLQLEIENCQDAEAGLMLLLLRELWLGRLPLGGGKGIGRGVLKGTKAELNYKGKKYTLGKDGLVTGGDYKALNGYVLALKQELAED